RRAVGEEPVEGVDEAGDPEGDGGEAEVLAGADAAPGAERRQAEVAAADVDVGAALRRDEPLRRERLRVGPHLAVVGDGPHVHHRRRARRHHHAVGEPHVGGGQPRPAQQRPRRVRPQRLLHHRLQVRHPRHVAVAGTPVAAHRRVHLRPQPRLHRRVPHHLRHAPLRHQRRRVRPTKYHLPEDGDHVVLGEVLVGLEGEEDVDEVGIVGGGGGGVAAEAVVADDAADERLDAGDERGAAAGDVVGVVEVGEPWEVVGPVERAEELEPLAHHALELLGLVGGGAGGGGDVVAPAEHAAHDVVERGGLEVGAEHDGAGGGLLGGHGGQHRRGVGLAPRLVRGDAARGEEVGGGDAAEEAPVLAAGGEPDGAREQQLPRRALQRAVGERRVREHLPRRRRARRHHRRRLPDGERHELPRPWRRRVARHRVERAVREAPGEREDAAEHGEPPGPLDGRRAEAAAAVRPRRPAGGRGPGEHRGGGEGQEDGAGE
ncbi:Os10g0403200, partial [Oryza sativa Japonica Group]